MKSILGRKMGMTQVFAQDGTMYPVTVIEVLPNSVLQVKTVETDDYDAIQVGYEDKKENRCNKAELGIFKKAGVSPKYEIAELKASQKEYKRRKRLAENYENRVEEMDGFLKRQSDKILEYDDDLVRRLVDNIQVVSNEMLIIHFKSGITMRQTILDEVIAEKERRKWEAKESRKSG